MTDVFRDAPTAWNRPSLVQRIAYAALMAPMRIVWGPLLASIPALYARNGSIGLEQIGMTIMLMRLLDVAVDPAIGVLSDRTRSRWGRRKPWILAGVLITLPASWFLFAIPPNAGIGYFGIFVGLTYLGWSLVEIPHTAWIGDLSRDDATRASLAGLRGAGISVGAIMLVAIPLLPIFATAALTPAVMRVTRWLVVVLLPLAALATLILTPTGVVASSQRPTFLENLTALARSRAGRILCLAILLSSLASGMCAACYFFYLDSYLGILAAFGYIGVATMLIGLPASLVWPYVIARIGKRAGLAISSCSSALALIAMAMVQRGPFAAPAVVTLLCITALTASGGGIATAIMAADAADDDEQRTGANKLGNFIAATTLCGKLGTALGAGLALQVLGLFHFNPKVFNNTFAMAGFRLTLFTVPCLLYLAAAVAAVRYPQSRSQKPRPCFLRFGQRD